LQPIAAEAEKPAAASPAGVEADVKSALVNLGYDERTAKPPSPKPVAAPDLPASEQLLRVTSVSSKRLADKMTAWCPRKENVRINNRDGIQISVIRNQGTIHDKRFLDS